MGHYELLADFAVAQGIPVTEEMQWLAKYDLLLHGKPRKLPAWVRADLSREYRGRIQGFFMDPARIAEYLPEYGGETSKQAERTAHLEVFPFDPATGEAGRVAVVFSYRSRNLLGRAAARRVPMEALGKSE
jgi:hypothetical protein